MPSKLYVGNLAYSVTNDDLEALFSQVGKVASAAVVSDKFSGQSRGFGFVEMESSGDAAKAISEFNGKDLKGRNLKVNEAKPREFGGGGGGRIIVAAVRPRCQPLVEAAWDGWPALSFFTVKEAGANPEPRC